VILVTIGTTLVFDDLFRGIDDLAARGVFAEPVTCQIGNSRYLPTHCEYFRFRPDIDQLMEQASLVICHGGTGTVLSLLANKRTFIAVANPAGAENHQAQFLERLNRQVNILWTRDLAELPALLRRSASFVIEPTHGAKLADDLRAYIDGT